MKGDKMKHNKLKAKWDSLPLYQRDIVWRFVASVGTLLLLIGMSECAHNKIKKNTETKSNKTTQVLQDVPEDYIKFREEYIKQQHQKQK